MLYRRILALILALTSSGTPCLASDELPDIGDGRMFGHFIDDEGNVVLGVTYGRSNFEARLVRWTASDVKTLEVNHGGDFPILFKDIGAAPGGGNEVRLHGVMVVDDSSHGEWVQQAYRLTNRSKLRRLWSIDASQWIHHETSLAFSPDGTMWGAMAHHPTKGLRTEGRHFAFGSTKSANVKRRETLVFHEERRRLHDTDFCFLSSDGPTLLAPYGNDVYLLRFTEFGVDSRPIEQLEPVRAAFRGMLFVRWQADDRILWGNDGQEWAAWDLWDLGLSGFPDEPFLRLESSSGEPHPVRGFVRKTVTDRGYRVEHLWQSPQAEHLNEHHASDWRPGKPISVSVSPNGRHAVALEEVREEKDGEVESHQVLRRFELAPLPPPPPRPARVEEEP